MCEIGVQKSPFPYAPCMDTYMYHKFKPFHVGKYSLHSAHLGIHVPATGSVSVSSAAVELMMSRRQFFFPPSRYEKVVVKTGSIEYIIDIYIYLYIHRRNVT